MYFYADFKSLQMKLKGKSLGLLKVWIFSVCAPQLRGRISFAPPDARAIFLHCDLLCNGTSSVSGGRITYWGAQTEKVQRFLFFSSKNFSLIAKWVLPLNIEVFLSLNLKICNLLEAWSAMISLYLRISMSIKVVSIPVNSWKTVPGLLLIYKILHFTLAQKKFPFFHIQIRFCLRLAVSQFVCPQSCFFVFK